jgi:hypothetical protein
MSNSLAQYVTFGSSFSLTNFVSGSISLSGIYIQRVTMHLSSSLFDNRREDGTSIVDARVLLPTSIDVDVICGTIDAVEKINNILKDINSIYTITSKGLTFQNLTLKNNSIIQSPDVLSASPIKLSFQQRLLQNNNNPTCAQTGDASIIDNGITNLKNNLNSATNSIESAATSVSSFTSNLFKNAFS